jgi:hypothetical protein
VGLSRHRESADLFYSRETFAHEADLIRTLGRERQKDISLDYTKEKLLDLNKNRGLKDLPTPEEKHRLDQFLREGLIASQQEAKKNLAPSSVAYAKDDLNNFMREYEKRNPEKAKFIQNDLKPRHEVAAMEAKHEMERLEKHYSASTSLATREKIEYQLKQLSTHVTKDKAVMAYLQEKQPEFLKQIENHAKKEISSRHLSRGHEMDFGHSR